MDRSDPEYLNVQDSLMIEAINVIKNGIIRKLASAKKMIDFDKEIAAGIYESFELIVWIPRTLVTKQNDSAKSSGCGMLGIHFTTFNAFIFKIVYSLIQNNFYQVEYKSIVLKIKSPNWSIL